MLYVRSARMSELTKFVYMKSHVTLHVKASDQGPVARSLVLANRGLRGVKTYRLSTCLYRSKKGKKGPHPPSKRDLTLVRDTSKPSRDTNHVE